MSFNAIKAARETIKLAEMANAIREKQEKYAKNWGLIYGIDEL